MSPNRSETKNGSFEIKNLEAGDYKIEIESPDEPGFVVSQDQPHREASTAKVYGYRYYPDVPRQEADASLHLGEGESLRLDIALESHDAHSLSESSPRRASSSMSRYPFRYAPAIHSSSTKQMATPGVFRVDGLASGAYRLSLTAGKPPRQLAADYEIEIGDRDVENFEAALLPEAGIIGEIRMLEPEARPPELLSVAFVPIAGWLSTFGKRGMIVGGSLPVIRVPVKGAAFHEPSIRPGDYWPQVMALPRAYAVVEIRFEGSSPLKNFVTLSAAVTPLTIVLTSRPGAVAGFVHDENEAAVRGATVALFPDPMPEKIAPATVSFTESGEGGAFSFKDVAPGTYRALVISEIDFRGDGGDLRAMLGKAI